MEAYMSKGRADLQREERREMFWCKREGQRGLLTVPAAKGLEGTGNLPASGVRQLSTLLAHIAQESISPLGSVVGD